MSTNVSKSDWAIYVALAVIWGSSFILIKSGLQYFSPVGVAAMRISIAGIALLPLAIRGFKLLTPKEQFYSLMLGLTGSGIPAFLFATAQTRVESGIAGILNSLTPIFILITGWLFYKTRYSFMQTLGVVVGFVGCTGLILLSRQPHGEYDNHIGFALLIVFATFLYGLSNQILMHPLAGKSTLLITPLAFVYMSIPALIILGWSGTFQIIHENPEAWKGVGFVAILSLFGTAAAMLSYNYLAQRTGVAFAGTVTYLMPVVSILWSFIDDEYIGWQHFGAMGLILAGVYLVRRPAMTKNVKGLLGFERK